MAHPFRRPLSLAAIWLVLPIVGALISATLEPIPPHDYWWHLVMGRLIAAGVWPDSNFFLYTLAADVPFVDQPWLGQWLMFVTYDSLGHAGLVLLRNILLVGAFALLISTAWRRCEDARAVGVTGLLAASLAYPVMTVRTRMFAFLPFALVLWTCLGVADGRLRKRWLAVVPLATLFWANCHGSFVLAIAVTGAVGVGAIVEDLLDLRRLNWSSVGLWSGVVAAVVVAGAVTPLGFGVYQYVLQLTMESSVASSVTEWLPPDVGEPLGMIFLAALVLSVLLLAWRRTSVPLGDVLLFGGTLVLAAGAMRSMFWWAAVLPAVLAPQLATLLSEDSTDTTPSQARLNTALFALAIVAGVFVQPGLGRAAAGELMYSGVARQGGEGAWVLNHENATQAVDQINRDHRARVFHDQVLGGMLEYKLTGTEPAQVAFVDQRMEWVPEAVWKRYFALSSAAQNWDRELDRLEVDTLLLSPESQAPLVAAAVAHPAWNLVGVDQSHVLFYRAGSLDRAQNPAEQQ